MYLKSGFLAKSFSTFVILAESSSAGFKYLNKEHLKPSLWWMFWKLMKPVFGLIGSINSFSDFISLLPAKGLYFKTLISWSISESIIQPETLPKNFVCSITL